MCVVLPSNPYKRMISLLSSPWIPSGLLSLSLYPLISFSPRERERVERLDLNTRIYMKKRYDKFFSGRRRSRGTSLTGNKMLCKKNEWRRRWRRKRREKKKERLLLLHSSPRFLSFPLTFLLPARKECVLMHSLCKSHARQVLWSQSVKVSPLILSNFKRERERGIERHEEELGQL